MRMEGTLGWLVGFGLSLLGTSALAQHPSVPEHPSPTPNSVEYHVTRWNQDDGLQQSTIHAIEESAEGFLWIGTANDLIRFDGETFTPIRTTTRIDGILALEQARDGALWIGTSGQGLLRHESGDFQVVGEHTSLGEIQNLLEDSAGVLWIGGSEALGRIGANGIELVLPHAVHDLELDTDGVGWAATDAGVWKLEEAPRHLDTNGHEVELLAAGRSGTMWAVGFSFVAAMQGERLGPITNTSPTQHNTCATLDVEGNLVVGGEHELRTYRVSQELLRTIQAESTATLEEPVLALHLDHQGNLWLGTKGQGLVRLARPPFRRLATSDGVNAPVRGVAATLDAVWLENFNPYFLRHDVSGLSRIDINNDGQLSAVQILGATANDVLWAWSSNGRIVRVEPIGSCDVWELAYRQLEGVVFDGEVTWLGSELGLVRFDGEDFTSIPLAGLGAVKPTTVDADGGVWFLYQGGIGRYRHDDLQLHELDGSPIAKWRDLTFDATGTGWITTYGEGLLRFRDGDFQRIDPSHGLGDSFLGGVIAHAGCLWINTNNGVMVASIADLNFVADGKRDRAHVRMLQTGEGNGSMSAMGPDGNLWFPNVDGVTVVDPEVARPVSSTPPVLVGGAVADNTSLTRVGGVLEVQPGTSSLEIAYTAATLSRQTRPAFRYRLLGSDDDWTEAGQRRVAYFTHLAPGDYVFEVAATGDGSGWSPVPARLPVSVLPFLHETWWFRSLIVAAAIGLVLALYRYRVGLLRRHNAALHLEIVEREKLEAERREIEERLHESQRLEAIGRLAGGIAHDFNNVLTAMLGRTELLGDSSAVRQDPELTEHVQSLHDSGHRAASLTRQLLAFSRQQVLQPQVLDANLVISGLDSMLRHLMPDNVLMGLDIRAQGSHIRVDPSQLEQVVMNLVLNARDAMPSGGQIRVKTEAIDLDGVAGDLNPDGRSGAHLVISVEDTGHGIDDATLPHVFEPFFTTKPGAMGTGLGLASVHGIVNQSGGFITVKSAPNQGTTFRVLLPIVHQEPVVVVQPKAPLQRGGPETILLCDDDDHVRETLSTLLRNHGYRVHVAASASEALDIAQDLPGIRLLITDVIMPEMDGRQLATEIESRYPQIRVLFISGYLNDIDLQLGFDPGSAIKGFLEKPFAPVRLLREVRRLLLPELRSVMRK